MPELTREEFEAGLKKLREWFPPDDHEKRETPGSGEWWYIKWQRIRERLDEAFGCLWSDEYTDPVYVHDVDQNPAKSICVVRCTITIDGRPRQGVGDAYVQLLSGKGKDMARGTPIERARADAFRQAAESWGIGRYLDNQNDDKKKREFFNYLHQRGNSKPMNDYLQETGRVPTRKPRISPKDDTGLMDAIAPPKATPKPSATVRPAVSTNKQRFQQLCQWTGKAPKDLRAIAETLSFPTDSDKLTPQQADQIRNEIFIQWGLDQGVFSNPFHARNSYLKIVNEEPQLTDVDIWDRWVVKVGEKKTDLVTAN